MRTVSVESLHSTKARRDIQKLIRELTIDQGLVQPVPKRVAIVDDMVTTGASFRAAMHHLRAVFPAAHIVGFFVARRIPLDDDDDFAPDDDFFAE